MSLQLIGTALFSCIAGIGLGLAWGKRIWGPKWFDTTEGINRRLRRPL